MFDINPAGLFTGPVDAVLKVGDDELKKHAAKAILGTGYSAVITFLFELGRRKLFGLGPALQQTARSIYLSLVPLADKGLLALAVPKDLLDPDQLKRFQDAYSQKI